MNLSDKEKLNSLNEVRILASVKSNFVISYKEAFFDVTVYPKARKINIIIIKYVRFIIRKNN